MQKNGFTLLEIIIYTALVGMVLTSVVYISQIAFQVRGKTRNALLVEENMRYAMTLITNYIRNANSVESPSAGETSGTLNLGFSDVAKNPTIITTALGKIIISEGASDAIPITVDDVEVTNLQFTRISGTPATVLIALTGQVRNALPKYNYTVSLQNTAVIRR